MRCLKCDKFLGFTFNAVPVLEGFVCPQCFEALGFEKKERKHFNKTSFEEIKNGRQAYVKSLFADAVVESIRANPPIRFSHYGEERDLQATDEERMIFSVLQELAGENELRFVRKSDNYVTAKCGYWDLARFKFTDRARWIFFPVKEKQKERHLINSPDDVRDFSSLVRDCLDHIKKYS